MAGYLRDGAPDAWGRRVIINRLTGLHGDAAQDVDFDELIFMLNSGSDRIGALDFQRSPDRYQPREQDNASLEELQDAAGHVERGEPTPAGLEKALFHGSSIGGARPKALIEDGDTRFIAKFSASNDTYAVVKSEYVAMRLAARVSPDVALVVQTSANGKDILLVQRFDRAKGKGGWTRKAMVSALTMLGLTELQAHYASYVDLAQIARARFVAPRETLRELFARMVFNILVGNTDDHARNHAALWDGATLALTPAYDICPQGRNGREANQAMAVFGDDRRSLLEHCRLSAPSFLLSDVEARDIINSRASVIVAGWPELCDEIQLSQVDRSYLWRRQILNNYAFDGCGREARGIVRLHGQRHRRRSTPVGSGAACRRMSNNLCSTASVRNLSMFFGQRPVGEQPHIHLSRTGKCDGTDLEYRYTFPNGKECLIPESI